MRQRERQRRAHGHCSDIRDKGELFDSGSILASAAGTVDVDQQHDARAGRSLAIVKLAGTRQRLEFAGCPVVGTQHRRLPCHRQYSHGSGVNVTVMSY